MPSRDWRLDRLLARCARVHSQIVTGLPYGAGGGKMLIPGVKLPYLSPPGGFYAGSINGVPLAPADIAQLTVIAGALAWQDERPWQSGRYSVWLAHGDPSPPQDLRWAAQKLCSYFGKAANYPDRAAQVVTEGATIFFALPSADRPTGIPEVDGVLNRYRLQSVI